VSVDPSTERRYYLEGRARRVAAIMRNPIQGKSDLCVVSQWGEASLAGGYWMGSSLTSCQ
jgi:hypothetical protein